MKTAIFRVDGGSKIGIGHIVRCLALADYMAKKGYQCSFICKDTLDSLHQFISLRNYTVLLLPVEPDFVPKSEYEEWLASSEEWDAIQTQVYLENPVDVLVVDHYSLSEVWENSMAAYSKVMVAIDDLATRRHSSDILIDFGLGRKETDYNGLIDESTKLLCGADYILVPSAYRKMYGKRSLANHWNGEIHTVLINFGGSDPFGLTIESIEAIRKISSQIKIKVITSSANRNFVNLSKIELRDSKIEVHKDVKEPWCIHDDVDFAIGSFGMGALERCMMGVPSLNFKFADNQTFQMKKMLDLGICLESNKENIQTSIENYLKLLPKDRARITEDITSRCSKLFLKDGRLSSYLEIEKKLNDIHFKAFSIDEADVLFEWQSLEGTRKYFRNSEVPSYQEHKNWVASVLRDKRIKIWLISFKGEQVGYIRLDEVEGCASEVAVFVHPGFQGRGIAKIAIDWIKYAANERELKAYICSDNKASVMAFKACGFERSSTSDEYTWNGYEE